MNPMSCRPLFCVSLHARRPRVLALLIFAAASGAVSSARALAQETALPENAETSAATPAPAISETPAAQATPEAQATPAATPEAKSEVPLELSAATPAKNAARLFAQSWKLENGIIIAEGEGERGVRLENNDTRVFAKRIFLDVQNRTARAEGKVLVERTRSALRNDLRASRKMPRGAQETIVETLRGENFQYDFKTQTGSLDNTVLQLSNFDVEATSLLINGRRYEARNVILRPGALTEAEQKIYGTPPLNLRAKSVVFEAGASTRAPNPVGVDGGGPETGNTQTSNAPGGGGLAAKGKTRVRGAYLYFKNTRLFPVPSAILQTFTGGARDPQAFNITPRIAFNSSDGLLLTGVLRYPLSSRLDGPVIDADLGVSTRVGFRGGATLGTETSVGNFALGYRKNDVVTTQLTNRIVLDRKPELTYNTRRIGLFSLPGGRRAALRFSAGYGRYAERQIGDTDTEIDASRSQGAVRFTTRGANPLGPYLDLFARLARYSDQRDDYRNAGYEVGYVGQFLPRVRGQISYSSTSLAGRTPFRFDRVEIRRELRTTLDFELTPRYLIPLDVRYDLDRSRIRDSSFGVLRNYKTFAYGVEYQTARRELKLAFRNGF